MPGTARWCLAALALCALLAGAVRAMPAAVFTGDVVISEFATATSDRLIGWSESGVPYIGMGIPWTDLSFSDSGWLEGPGGFGTSGSGVLSVVNIAGKAYSLYTRRVFTVATNDALRGDPLELMVDFEDGFVAYLNGKEIARKGLAMPGGFCYHDQRANNALQHCGSNETFVIGIASNLLVSGANILAVSVHTAGMSDTPWRLVSTLRLTGTPAVDLVLPAQSWRYFIGSTEPLGGLRKPAVPAPELPEPWLVMNEYPWRYYPGTNEPSGAPTTAWAGLGFNDSGWRSGPGSFGYGDPGILTTISVLNVAYSFYIRQTFMVSPEQLAAGNQLQLSVMYDDGFVAYINGKEVARANVGTNAFIACNKAAAVSHEASQIERFFINNASNVVAAGTNVLAIQTHNSTLSSGDLSMMADLDMVYNVAGSYEAQNVSEDLDWIELYNRGTQAVALTGWSLTDDPALPDKWVLPYVIMETNSYFIVLATGLNTNPTNGAPNTNFKLSSEGEYLALMDNGTPRRARCTFDPGFPAQSYFHSFGLAGPGNDYRYLGQPTPGSANSTNATYDGILPAPQVSTNRGFYSAPVALTLTPPLPDATVMYTTNGTVPTLSKGILYTGTLALVKTTAVRARAFKPGFIPSKVVTHTYLVNELAVKKTLPAICLVGDEQRDLFEPHGLMAISGGYSNWWPATTVDHYNNGTPTGQAYERQTSMELIYPGDNRNVQINAGLRTAGQGGRGSRRRGPDWSQQTYKYDLRLYFRSSYGTERLVYPIYTNSPVMSFDKICIKSGFWDDCINPALKDELSRRLWLDCGQLASHGIHVNLYINGLYKTYYNLIERPEENFFQDHYDSTNAWEVFKLGVAEGDTKAWNELLNYVKSGTNNPTVYANYQWMTNRLDVVNFIDYLLVCVYSYNSDWPGNNWVSAREHKAGARFRFYPWDAGCSFGYSGNTVTNNTFAKIYGFVAGGDPTAIFYNFLHSNTEFRLLFADRIQKHFFNNGALTDLNVSNRYMELKAPLEPIVTFVQSNYNNAKFNNNVVTTWIPQRRPAIFGHFRLENLWPSLSAPYFNQQGGTLSNGVPVTIAHTNAAGSIYYTLDGADPRAAGGGIAGVLYTNPFAVARVATVRARVFNTGEWSAVNEAAFVYAYPFDAVKLSEVMYNPAAGGSEFVELYNSANEAVPLSDPLQPGNTWRLEDDTAALYQFPSGAVLNAQQYAVVVGQGVDMTAFVASNNVPGNALVFGPATRNLGNSGDAVRLLRPNGAGAYTVVEQMQYDDAPPWPPEADGQGPALQRISFNASAADATNWMAGPAGGTPGCGPPAPPGFLDITNANFSVPNELTSVVIGGTNNAYIVGGMAYECHSNSLAGSLVDARTIAAAQTWQAPVSNLVVGLNVVQVSGTNVVGEQRVDTLTITRAVGAPWVDITNVSATVLVPHDVATYDLAGTNNASTAGLILWNTALGESGSVPAAPTGWTFRVTLTTGTNVIVAAGMNIAGAASADTVTVIRATASRDWYVAANGTGDGLGPGSPTQNVAAVLGGARAQDAVYLKGGDVFAYPANALTVSVAVTIRSYGAGQGILSNTTMAVNGQLLNIINNASGATLDNIQLLFMDGGLTSAGYRTLHVDNGAGNITIRNCTFQHLDAPGGNAGGNPFIALHASTHANLTISNNVFRDLRYAAGLQYRHYVAVLSGANDLLMADNTVSNYEGFLSFNAPASYRVRVIGNTAYRCYGDINWTNFSFGTAGGLACVRFQALAGGTEFGGNIVYNGFPDMTGSTRFAALYVERSFNNGKVYNNTFYGLGAACIVASFPTSTTNLLCYNNILLACNAQALTGFYSVMGGIQNGVVYSNLWTRFDAFTNRYYGIPGVPVAGNPRMDPRFASLDPGNAGFLRPTVAAALNGYGGTYIGARLPLDLTTFVNITNAHFSVAANVSDTTIGGTNNEHVVGTMWWESMTGARVNDSGTLSASASWTITISNLIAGATNIVDIIGTNLVGVETYDTIEIYRPLPAGDPSDVADFVIALATANYRTITLGWSNGTINVLACTNQSYTSDLSSWFELASEVTSPWVHQDASNYPVIFYRIVSGTHTSQYDVGKYTVTLTPGASGNPAYNWISPPLELFRNTVNDVLGNQLNYDANYFDVLQAQIPIGGAQIDTYYVEGLWTDGNEEPLTRFATGQGYILVVDATHTAAKTVAFVGKVPAGAVTNMLTAPRGGSPAYNWIGAPTPALRAFFVNGLTNTVVTTETAQNFDVYQNQVTIGGAQKDWYYAGGQWDDGAAGTPLQTPGMGGILVLDQNHTSAATNWAAPKTR